MIALLLQTALAACPDGASAAKFALQLEDAEASFGKLEIDAFNAQMDVAAATLACVDEPLSPAEAARYHRLQGLRGFLVRDEARSNEAFLAARNLEPEYRFPETVVPGNHPIRDAYSQLPLDAAGVEALPAPADGYLLLDGRKSLDRPATTPVVFQSVTDGGAVDVTAYLWPGEATPAYEPAPLGSPRARPLAFAAGGAALASAGLYGVALQRHGVYRDLSTPPGQLDGLRSQTHALGVASASAAVVAVGTGVAWGILR